MDVEYIPASFSKNVFLFLSCTMMADPVTYDSLGVLSANVECRGNTDVLNHLNPVQHLSVAVTRVDSCVVNFLYYYRVPLY